MGYTTCAPNTWPNITPLQCPSRSLKSPALYLAQALAGAIYSERFWPVSVALVAKAMGATVADSYSRGASLYLRASLNLRGSLRGCFSTGSALRTPIDTAAGNNGHQPPIFTGTWHRPIKRLSTVKRLPMPTTSALEQQTAVLRADALHVEQPETADTLRADAPLREQREHALQTELSVASRVCEVAPSKQSEWLAVAASFMSQGKLTESVEEPPKDKRARRLARKNSMTAGDELYEGWTGTKEGPGRESRGRRYSSSLSSSRSWHCSGGALASSNAGQCLYTEAERVVLEAEQRTRRALPAAPTSSAASCGAFATASDTCVASSTLADAEETAAKQSQSALEA